MTVVSSAEGLLDALATADGIEIDAAFAEFVPAERS
jgi:hypothetical protein